MLGCKKFEENIRWASNNYEESQHKINTLRKMLEKQRKHITFYLHFM